MKRFNTVLLLAACLVLAGSVASADTFVRMVAGPSGGSWYPLGAKIMQVMQEQIPGIATSNGPGGGESNVNDVSQGNAEIGWTLAHSAYKGWVGKGTAFKRPQKNQRFFATLYPAVFQVAVRKDSSIHSYRDMADKNLSPGKAKWTGYDFAVKVLNAYGITLDQVKQNGGTVSNVGYNDSVALMKDKHLDVFFAVTSMPASAFIDLNFNPGIRFIPIDGPILDKLIKENPGFVRTEIPKTAYKGMTADVPTLGAVTILIVNKNLPDDLVYKMCDVFWKNHDTFEKVKGIWKGVKWETALKGQSIPFHPGAERYYRDKGLLK